MRNTLLYVLLICILCAAYPADHFLAEQKKYPRVRAAINEKEMLIETALAGKGLSTDQFKLMVVIFKETRELVLYVADTKGGTYSKLASYEICKLPGTLGPKRAQGDNQVPEGFYTIDRFNPNSDYYLSLGINYPNAADRIRKTAADPGGDIFIHGECVTIGCLPMTDDKIKEIYLYAVYARDNGEVNIPVYIFPFKMTDDNLEKYSEAYEIPADVLNFWKRLKIGYDILLVTRTELEYSIDDKGNYVFYKN